MKHSNIAFFVPHVGCPHTCSFCNQRSISGTVALPTAEDVEQTCRQALTEIADKDHTEIAFFGGSFTAIPRDYMLSLLKAAEPFCRDGMFSGIRISTRPDCISGEILALLKEYHVNAIELGVQSLNDQVLTLNERGHTAADVQEAIALIKEYGFSLGLQMMTGLYGDSKESTYRTAKQIIAYRPDTVRIYPTVVIKGTKLCEWYEAGIYVPPTLTESVELVADLMMQFTDAGIAVIRVGLHASEELERDLVAGAYHPAFRELCEGEIYYRMLTRMLEQVSYHDVIVSVHPREVSKLVGQSKRNKIRLNQAGYRLTIEQDDSLKPFTLHIKEKREVDYVT